MKLARNPDIAKWECGRCGTWNNIADGMCESCNAPAAVFARSFRLADTLSKEERLYYNTTVPEILRELKSIRRLLERRVQND